MIISVYFECCDSDVDWHSTEWYLRGCTYVIISMCLLCITEIILFYVVLAPLFWRRIMLMLIYFIACTCIHIPMSVCK